MIAELRRTLLVYGLAAAAVIAFWPSAQVIGQLWGDFANLSYAHGYLVAAVSIWLVFNDRRALAAQPLKPSWPGLALLLAGTVAWLVIWRASIRDMHVVMFPTLLWLSIYAALGWSMARRTAFAVGYIYFALPLWELITPALQMLTVYATRALVLVTRLPATFDGIEFHIPAGTFIVEGGCSGTHLFIVGLALATLLGEVEQDSLRRRLKLIGLMVGLALITNWVRVYSLVLFGHLTDMRLNLIRHHYDYGWVLFGISVVVFLWLARRMAPEPATSGQSAAHAPAASVVHAPVWGASAAAVLVLALALLTVYLAQNRADRPDEEVGVLQLPDAVGHWGAPIVAESSWHPSFTGASFQRQAFYRDSSGRAVEAFVVGYRSQRQDRELISSNNSLLGTPPLRELSAALVATSAGHFKETLTMSPTGERSVIWSVHVIAGRRIVTPFLAQLWYGLTTLLEDKSAGTIALRAPCSGSCEEARGALRGFAEVLFDGAPLASVAHTP